MSSKQKNQYISGSTRVLPIGYGTLVSWKTTKRDKYKLGKNNGEIINEFGKAPKKDFDVSDSLKKRGVTQYNHDKFTEEDIHRILDSIDKDQKKNTNNKSKDGYGQYYYPKSPYGFDKNENKPLPTSKEKTNKKWTEHTNEEKGWAYSQKQQQSKLSTAKKEDKYDINFLEATQNDWFQGGDVVNGKATGKRYDYDTPASRTAMMKEYEKYLKNPLRYIQTH